MEAIDALTKLTIITPSQSTNSTYNTSDGEDLGDFTISEDDQNTPTAIIEFVNRTAKEVPFYLKFRNEPWVIPLVALALFNVAAILIFEIYVLYKSCGGRRHLFLGQVLLLGLFLSSVLGLLYVPEPHWLFCGITRAGIGIVYSIVFGTLLVKCIFLLKIHSGVYFNASFQALLLFFIIAVEIAIVTQWLVYEPPNVTSDSTNQVVCGKSPLDRIEYLTYVMLLLFLVIVASIRARSLRENNKEALYIGVSIAIALIFWVAWISVAIIFDRRYEAPAEGFGLLCTSLVIFFLIFIPKAVHLSSPRSKLGNGSSEEAILSFTHLPSCTCNPTQFCRAPRKVHLSNRIKSMRIIVGASHLDFGVMIIQVSTRWSHHLFLILTRIP
ncbi:g_PROTEIN_RECEP_F3_4 domain-containing protein [Caerostris extrusa]|uniref:G_PROTEIN_RECEP_F3_4 domain-containing protein n=1 Tax=Caerostris extrusa TaxID=172846 RepID=A0AAV4XV32_CAEEX|nr:g_PROTEIN_RECEP_F3_4 domain-containing protein [Caerostris extrusa]